MTAIGVDTHKATLAACAIDELGRVVGEATFGNDPAGHLAFMPGPVRSSQRQRSASRARPLLELRLRGRFRAPGFPSAKSHPTSAGSSAGGRAVRARAIRATPSRLLGLPPVRRTYLQSGCPIERTRSGSSLRPERISSARRLVRETDCTPTCGSSCQATAGRSRTSSRLVIGRWSGASSAATQPSKGSSPGLFSTAYFVSSGSATCSRAGSRPSSMVIRSWDCRAPDRSPSPGSLPRPATCAASVLPTPSRPWPGWRRFRRVRDRSRGCASIGAATVSSTAPYTSSR
jgi:hypothetical protein